MSTSSHEVSLHPLPSRRDEVLFQEGLKALRLRDLPAAIEALQEAVQCNPQQSDYHFSLALAFHEQGNLDAAIQQYDAALSLESGHAEYYLNRGLAYLYSNQSNLAEADLIQSLSLNPGCAESYLNLGSLQTDQGRYPEARYCYEQALQLQPDSFETYLNLANLFQRQGETQLAMDCCRKALEINPHCPMAYEFMGAQAFLQSNIQEAYIAFKHVLKYNPHSLKALCNLGTIHRSLKQTTEAFDYFEKALAVDPHHVQSNLALGQMLQEVNRPEDAIESYRRLQSNSTFIDSTIAYTLLEALTLPLVYPSATAIQTWRTHLANKISTLLAFLTEHPEACIRDPLAHIGITAFYLAYQGFNDKTLQQQIAAIFQRTPQYNIPEKNNIPEKTSSLPAVGPKAYKIGFISRFLRKNHTIGKLTQGLIEHLSREHFSVLVFGIEDAALKPNLIPLPKDVPYIGLEMDSLEKAAEIIKAAQLDILYYCDIGMEPFSYFLAFSRLAPIQCVTWGHPVTTGIPNIDYFITQKDLESLAQPEAHYSEQPVVMEHMPIYYYRPKRSSPLKNRQEMGLPTEGHLYVCPQTHYKIHPEFDDILAGILETDPEAHIILIQAEATHTVAALRQRWETSLGPLSERISFINNMPYDDFLNLQEVADVLIDPIHFAGGNTSLEGFISGNPIVTMPGEFLRSRVTFGLYQKMGILDCVANNKSEYIQIATRLGCDPDFRAEIKRRILSQNHLLYEDLKGIRELETFFLRILEPTESGSPETS